MKEQDKTKPKEVKQLNIDIDAELHREFKAHCALEEIDMQKLIAQLMQERLDKYGDGNPAYTLNQWIDNPEFHATPALFRPDDIISEYITRIRWTPIWDELGSKLNWWATEYNRLDQMEES